MNLPGGQGRIGKCGERCYALGGTLHDGPISVLRTEEVVTILWNPQDAARDPHA
jgi:hypothetical protein